MFKPITLGLLTITFSLNAFSWCKNDISYSADYPWNVKESVRFSYNFTPYHINDVTNEDRSIVMTRVINGERRELDWFFSDYEQRKDFLQGSLYQVLNEIECGYLDIIARLFPNNQVHET